MTKEVRFLAYAQAAAVPNIIVDGAGNGRTILTLSHWPKSGSPPALRGDTSTDIVFNYLDSPAFHVEADAVSNNHFDEDGLVGIFALLHPDEARRHRELLADVARAGDFGVFERRHAARIAFVLAAYANPDRSPLPRDLFALPHADLASELYLRLFEVLPALVRSVEDYRALWEREDAWLTASDALVEQGLVTIDEQPDLDLASVRLPEGLTGQPAECHHFALYSRTACTRLLLVQGRRVEFRYRYESWVQLASRRPAARVDLTGLADELNREEASGGTWVFDGVDEALPKLHLEGSSFTSIPPDTVVRRVEHHLRTGRPAWDPYD